MRSCLFLWRIFEAWWFLLSFSKAFGLAAIQIIPLLRKSGFSLTFYFGIKILIAFQNVKKTQDNSAAKKLKLDRTKVKECVCLLCIANILAKYLHYIWLYYSNRIFGIQIVMETSENTMTQVICLSP